MIGVRDELKGEDVLVVAVLKQHITPQMQDDIANEIRQLVRERIGPIATPKAVHFVSMLPKTRSGKIMRRVIRAVYQGDNLGDLSTMKTTPPSIWCAKRLSCCAAISHNN